MIFKNYIIELLYVTLAICFLVLKSVLIMNVKITFHPHYILVVWGFSLFSLFQYMALCSLDSIETQPGFSADKGEYIL